jgi:nitrite reductase/ring-hydroxylating ferredoxin subunit
MDGGARVAGVDEVPAESSLLFTVRDVESDETREAILVRGDGAPTDGDDGDGEDGDDSDGEDGDDGSGGEDPEEPISAWLNYCQHFTHIRLDKGSGVPRRDGEIVCTNHGAMF